MQEIKMDRMVRSGRRTFSLEITPEARLVVRVPARASQELIKKFLWKNRFWIQSKQAMVQARRREVAPKKFVSGEEFLYLGRLYPLDLVEEDLPLSLEGHFRLSRKWEGDAKEIFMDWYKKQAHEVIMKRVEGYASRTGLRYQGLKISDAKKRWGSCSSKGRLRFNWRLVMAPLEVLDYVVAHELVHLEELNHTKRFWDKVQALAPDYKKHSAWLDQNHHRLDL